MSKSVKFGQNLLDMMLQLTGGLNGIVGVAKLNDLTLNQSLGIGQTIETSGITNFSVYNYYKKRQINPISRDNIQSEMIINSISPESYIVDDSEDAITN